MMKENISEKERFFSKVSHDLRGSFTSIIGFSDILNDPQEELGRDEINEFVARIGKQSKDSFDLLVNFINWLKLENYNYGLAKEKIDLLEIFYDVQNHVKQGLSNKNVSVLTSITENDFVKMDYEILISILNNIFNFIIKTCCEDSKIKVNSGSLADDFSEIEISSNCYKKDFTFLQNIDLKDLNNEISFPLIFAAKFVELCEGEFHFNIVGEDRLIIQLKLPKR